jgi:glycosyltransferase involved in cell wall biosynthesis
LAGKLRVLANDRGPVKIAILGTRGVPARYGGFETAVDEVGKRLVQAGHQVVVYCRNPGQDQLQHEGMQLVNLPAVRLKAMETLSHTALSAAHASIRARPDVALLFNAANAPMLPVLRAARIPTALHLDGLEWKRAKWHGLGARYYRAAERWSARLADSVIADAPGIAEHVRLAYGREAVLISYGATIISPPDDRLAGLGLRSRQYHLVVSRFAPENHVREIVEGYLNSRATLRLVVVGSAPYQDRYTRMVHALAHGDPRVLFLGGVWDQSLLNQLYGHSLSYLHGHSVGGTNPSLLRAMGAGAPVTAYDVVFNREVVAGNAQLFTSPADVALAVEADEADPTAAEERGAKGREHVRHAYRWDDVASDYEQLCFELAKKR